MLRLNEPLTDGVARKFDAIVYAQLFHDRGAVVIDGLGAATDRLCDLHSRHPFADHTQDL